MSRKHLSKWINRSIAKLRVGPGFCPLWSLSPSNQSSCDCNFYQVPRTEICLVAVWPASYIFGKSYWLDQAAKASFCWTGATLQVLFVLSLSLSSLSYIVEKLKYAWWSLLAVNFFATGSSRYICQTSSWQRGQSWGAVTLLLEVCIATCHAGPAFGQMKTSVSKDVSASLHKWICFKQICKYKTRYFVNTRDIRQLFLFMFHTPDSKIKMDSSLCSVIYSV